MEFKVVSAPELYLYMYNNCNDICGHAGYAGLTRVNFDGEQIVIRDFPSYFVKRDDIELNQYMKWLIKALSSDEDCGKMLSSPKAMKAYCEKHPEAEINEHDNEYGFMTENEKYTFLIRAVCTERCELFIYIYDKTLFAAHIKNASKGIRFIDSDYKDLFVIPDGGKIVVKGALNYEKTFVCRLVDPYHTEIGSGIYHICQFAEIMERNGATYCPFTEVN